MTNTALLNEYIEKSGYKKGFLAKALGITSYSLSNKINNKSEFKGSEIDLMCKLLNINVNNRMRIFFAK